MSLGPERTPICDHVTRLNYSNYLVVTETNMIQECGTHVIFYQYFNGKTTKIGNEDKYSKWKEVRLVIPTDQGNAFVSYKVFTPSTLSILNSL